MSVRVGGLHSSDYPLLPVQGLRNDTLPIEIITESIKIKTTAFSLKLLVGFICQRQA